MSRQVNFSFFCVQPIELSPVLYRELITKKINLKDVGPISEKQDFKSKWLYQYTNIYDTYEDLFEYSLEGNTDHLIQFLHEHHTENMRGDLLDLGKFYSKSEVTLLFDPRFIYFVLVYQIEFSFPFEELLSFLDFNETYDNTKNTDPYNVLRKTIVRESKNSEISVWGDEIQQKSLEKAKNVLEHFFSTVSISTDHLHILPNTCNITNFVFMDNLNQNRNFVDKLISLNLFAERITAEKLLEPLYNNTVYFSFNGRFHTIVYQNQQDKYRFYPLQFHIQFIWFLIERYNKIMNGINREIMQTAMMPRLQYYARIIHEMINKIELLNLHDMNFKHSIEADIGIYEKNEKKWSIPNLLKGSKQYVSFFKDYLDRLFAHKNTLFQKKMNLILFIISFLQLLALVSVWNDYLSMINESNLNIDERVLSFFGTTYSLTTFNIFVPVFLMVIMAGFGLYLWKHRVK